jgi:hypothetical protein
MINGCFGKLILQTRQVDKTIRPIIENADSKNNVVGALLKANDYFCEENGKLGYTSTNGP